MPVEPGGRSRTIQGRRTAAVSDDGLKRDVLLSIEQATIAVTYRIRKLSNMVTHPVINGYQLSVPPEFLNLNFSHAVCFTSIISDVYTDRKLLLYFKHKNTWKVGYVSVIIVSDQEHNFL